jgi:hypothetical protein
LTLELGKVDDFDITFWNGQQVGSKGSENSAAWNTERKYTIPGRLVKAGRNVLAVRIWDWFGGGGFQLSRTRYDTAPGQRCSALSLPSRLSHRLHHR